MTWQNYTMNTSVPKAMSLNVPKAVKLFGCRCNRRDQRHHNPSAYRDCVVADLAALAKELAKALSLTESVYRQNCVSPGEPSTVLVNMQTHLAKARAAGLLPARKSAIAAREKFPAGRG